MLAVMRGLAIATVVAVVRAAAAEPAPSEAAASEATEIFNQARALAKDGRFDEACVLFAKSYDLDPGLGTAVNLADCLERQGKLYRAWVLFDLVARNSQSVQSRARPARGRHRVDRHPRVRPARGAGIAAAAALAGLPRRRDRRGRRGRARRLARLRDRGPPAVHRRARRRLPAGGPARPGALPPRDRE